MRIADTLLNPSEEVAVHELQSIARDNELRVFAKPRLSDVIQKGDSHLAQRVFDFYTKAHVDFVITNHVSKPIMIVEYDGRYHTYPRQQERDQIKDDLCANAGLGVLRINANHVTRLYRGITVLRWIVEVSELQRYFDEAQTDRQIPYDEPFDPIMIYDDGHGKRWPYWLSASANSAQHSFFRKLDSTIPKGHAGIIGSDQAGNSHYLSYMWFGDQVIYAKTAIRKQHVDFLSYDLLGELTDCELGILLSKFRQGQHSAISIKEFRRTYDLFCSKHNVRHSGYAWDFAHRGMWGVYPTGSPVERSSA